MVEVTQIRLVGGTRHEHISALRTGPGLQCFAVPAYPITSASVEDRAGDRRDCRLIL
jgi:hypothetical protein